MLTVDVVVLSGDPPAGVLLIRRGNPPFAGDWALPGGFVDEREPTRRAAARELREETGLESAPDLELVGVYDAPDRDPRGWSVSVAYRAGVGGEEEVAGADDADDARWFALGELPALAFDHAEIIADAVAAAATRPPA
ncbi:MAG: 8-oxo-dGTP diphosphatase [Solirubrobacteraceae bacterium]|jgi:8-oxo-dGTP diphosphatase|nr:8-oxo-dGTP diphosphatase [Solirubrobacteraceae bacterium]